MPTQPIPLTFLGGRREGHRNLQIHSLSLINEGMIPVKGNKKSGFTYYEIFVSQGIN